MEEESDTKFELKEEVSMKNTIQLKIEIMQNILLNCHVKSIR